MPLRPPMHRPPGQRAKPVGGGDPHYHTDEWQRLRRVVLAHDRGVCAACGQPGADTVAHIVPRKQGGADTPANLRSLHAACHSRESAARGERWG